MSQILRVKTYAYSSYYPAELIAFPLAVMELQDWKYMVCKIHKPQYQSALKTNHKFPIMEPLLKATPDVRTPLYKGHFAESQIHYFSTNQPPEIRPPLYKGQNFVPNGGHYKPSLQYIKKEGGGGGRGYCTTHCTK